MPRDIYDEGEEHGWVTPRGPLHDHRHEHETLPKAKTYNESGVPLSGRDDVPWPVCPTCHDLRHIKHRSGISADDMSCETCGGVGYLGVPTDDATCLAMKPGSVSRVACYRARYRAGLTVFPRG